MAVPPDLGISYQWRFNGTNDAPGATNSSLTLANAQPADGGVYSVWVSNVFGSILSSNATLRVDHVPMADAGATRSPVISGNGVDATVILDGSRSSDADQDMLQYQWFSALNAQPSALLASGVVATSVLPVGAHPLMLVVTDRFFSSTNSATVEVITTAQAVERLLALVQAAGLRTQPLQASLEAALASIRRSDPYSAAGQLGAFENKVRAQVVGENAVLTAVLLTAAHAILDVLSPGDPGRMAAKIISLEHRNGKPFLKIRATPGRPQIVEASTNLVNWELIGLATEREDGVFEFEDIPRFPYRYYRTVVP
jgi:hypothetical protein